MLISACRASGIVMAGRRGMALEMPYTCRKILLILHLLKRIMEETQSQSVVTPPSGTASLSADPPQADPPQAAPLTGAAPLSADSQSADTMPDATPPQADTSPGAPPETTPPQATPPQATPPQAATSQAPRELRRPVKQWYAIYTNSRAEKRVHERLIEQGIESFLPLQKTLRQWSDRKKLVERPLISSYVFVKIIHREYFTVRKTEGVVKFIMIQGKPIPIPEEQITNLRILCGSDADVEISAEVYEKGDMVEVTVGSLTGLRGELIRVGRKHKVVIRVIQPGMNLTVDIKTNAIRKIGKNTDI